MNELDTLRLAAIRRSLCTAELRNVERVVGVEIVPQVDHIDTDNDYYPQFQEAVRAEASSMAGHYEIFYCLEKSIRSLIAEKLLAEVGPDWWKTIVPENVQQNAAKNKQREIDSGMTIRSDDWIDYTTFGELGEIVRGNWPRFADVFSSLKAFDRVMTSLNLLRGPIAHCCPLATDEADRLRLTLRDWFRLME